MRDGAGNIEGNLTVHTWRDFTSEYSEHPQLRWCRGEQCDAMWCTITAADYAECGIEE